MSKKHSTCNYLSGASLFTKNYIHYTLVLFGALLPKGRLKCPRVVDLMNAEIFVLSTSTAQCALMKSVSLLSPKYRYAVCKYSKFEMN